MNKVKDGKTYYLKEDRRKNLKVLFEDGDQTGVIPSIVYPKVDEKIILPNGQVYWKKNCWKVGCIRYREGG